MNWKHWVTTAALVSAALVGSPQALAEDVDWSALDLKGVAGDALEAQELEGKVVLVVNVASFCGYTPQYEDLQLLWSRYRDRGLMIVGVPCNQFGGQEPGSDDEIRNFCTTRYGVTFPLLHKQDVNGPGRSTLYKQLVRSDVGDGEDIGWNFEKFLIDRNGDVIGRFPSHTVPLDPRLTAAIEMALGSS